MTSTNRTLLVAFFVGVLVGALATHLTTASQSNALQHTHEGGHQITHPDEEYHVHADFLIYINDVKLDLARDELMTTNEQELHEHVHLHDGNGEILHIHAPGIPFVEFLDSLSITVTNDCITVAGTRYCEDTINILRLFVNNVPYDGLITEYIPEDDDAVLLYYGDYNEETITTYMNEVKNDACYYSGTCPERGVAPPESCGLTCEL